MSSEQKMPLLDEFRTVRSQGTAEIKVKGSRFVATVASIGSEGKAKRFIEEISRRHFDATHNCYAYRVGYGDGAFFRFSDAGEPSGTAGRPILEAIEGRGLTNALVVVSRYFGGTKLGTGGLALAYKESALTALDKVGSKRTFQTVELTMSFPYHLTKEVQRLLGKHGARVLGEKYGGKTSLTVSVRKSRSERFREELVILGGGQVKVGNVT
jgi:uncharacterized YigZ family protein